MKKILVVDDELLICQSIEKWLKKEGYEVITATRGEEALSKLETERPLVMLLDVRMPEMDGMEVLARAKAEHPSLKIIMLTGVADEWLAHTAISMGAADYITKPPEPKHLKEKIDSLLSE